MRPYSVSRVHARCLINLQWGLVWGFKFFIFNHQENFAEIHRLVLSYHADRQRDKGKNINVLGGSNITMKKDLRATYCTNKYCN